MPGHIYRVSRESLGSPEVEGQPGRPDDGVDSGNVLLVGVSGVGRKSVTRMAAFMAEYSLKSIEITRSYDTAAFREDLKSMMFSVSYPPISISTVLSGEAL